MKYITLGVLLVLISTSGRTQTCTVTGTSPLNWTNPGPNCTEGGDAGGATILVIPAGFILVFDSNTDTWTGTRIDVYGTLLISAPGQVTINSSLRIKSGGLLDINSKLNLASGTGCLFSLVVEAGASVNIVGSTPDRLNICGVEIARGGGAGCNPFPAGPLPFCEPGGGFTGPLGIDEFGINATLPVDLISFGSQIQNNSIRLNWSTSKEEGFDHFVVQHAYNTLEFEDLGDVTGAGYNSNSIQQYSFTDGSPLIGTNYYRLKAVDLDGSIEYFGPISQSFDSPKAIWITPNPTKGSQVNFKMNFTPTAGDHIMVVSQMGVIHADVSAVDTDGSINFGSDIMPGPYILKYMSNGFARVARFVVVE